jgi:hypothetical protein
MITGNPTMPDESGLLETLQVAILVECASLCPFMAMRSDVPLALLLAFILMSIALIFIVREIPRCTLEDQNMTCVGKHTNTYENRPYSFCVNGNNRKF